MTKRNRHGKLLSATILAGATVATLAAAAGASAQDAGTDDSPERPAACDPADLHLEASPELPEENIVIVSVTRAAGDGPECAIDRIPTVTFANLDGSAEAVPPTESAPYALSPGESAHAAIRTAPAMDDDGVEVVQFMTVGAAPDHEGTVFFAEELDMADPGIYVYEPITTWWQTSQDEALQELFDNLP